MKDCPYLEQRGERWFFIIGIKRALKAGWFWRAGDGVLPRQIGKPKSSIPLGRAVERQAIASIRKQALELYEQYLTDSGLSPTAPAGDRVDGYPPDSLGAWFRTWTRGDFVDWTSKGPRTRDDYARAWKYLDPKFGRRGIHTITPDEFANWQKALEDPAKDQAPTVSPSERYRIVKCARGIFKAAVARKIIAESPALLLPNPIPKGRSGYFLANEIFRLVATAFAEKKEGLGLIVWTLYETAFAPVDGRTASLALIKRNVGGFYLHRERTKTGAEVYAALSDDLVAAIEAYVQTLRRRYKIELTPSAPLFRMKRGGRYVDHVALGKDFAKLRVKALGEGERRQLLDIRRSANLELQLGGATPEERAEILANTLDKSRFLDETYTPPTLALARQAAAKRDAGRAALAAAAGDKREQKLKCIGSISLNESKRC